MTRPPIRIRSAVTAVAVVAAFLVAMPSAGARQLSDAQCISYKHVVDAPKGKIPRDDMHTMRVDPIARWAKANPAAARDAIAGGASSPCRSRSTCSARTRRLPEATPPCRGSKRRSTC